MIELETLIKKNPDLIRKILLDMLRVAEEIQNKEKSTTQAEIASMEVRKSLERMRRSAIATVNSCDQLLGYDRTIPTKHERRIVKTVRKALLQI